ncbi:hypothetical protein JAAARDRAFT_205660 [Jaapia argillacea MUCL 33604]|uniref:F-box domain-containing protein n=1 Tax=Jaapia argillacea MUCL 33604 TaxID=933084 RepID=A0A067Q0G0_9AGAM|nr:hypothetical protein JAAARDRAFT_205660 [Jaapia argillacea MUCL 33604]
MLVTLPRDILLYVFRYLKVRDIISVRQTCSTLYLATEHRSVWLYAAQDINYALPQLLDLAPMSKLELMKHVMREANVDSAWRYGTLLSGEHEAVTPINRTYPHEGHIFRVQFLSGGEWIVVVSRRGEITLRRVNDWSVGASLVSQPEIWRPSQAWGVKGCHIGLSTKQESILAITFIMEQGRDVIHVFRLKTSPTPSVDYMFKAASRHGHVRSAYVGGPFLTFVVPMVSNMAKIHVVSLEDPKKQIVMQLQDVSFLHGVAITRFFSKSRLILVDEKGISIVNVPPMPLQPSSITIGVDGISAVDITDVEHTRIHLFNGEQASIMSDCLWWHSPAETLPPLILRTRRKWSSESPYVHIITPPRNRSESALPTHNIIKLPTLCNSTFVQSGSLRSIALENDEHTLHLLSYDELDVSRDACWPPGVQIRSIVLPDRSVPLAFDEISGRICSFARATELDPACVTITDFVASIGLNGGQGVCRSP